MARKLYIAEVTIYTMFVAEESDTPALDGIDAVREESRNIDFTDVHATEADAPAYGWNGNSVPYGDSEGLTVKAWLENGDPDLDDEAEFVDEFTLDMFDKESA
jgi:hypothetical protein